MLPILNTSLVCREALAEDSGKEVLVRPEG